MVGAAMGTTALSGDGRWWAVPVKAGPVTRFRADRHRAQAASVFLERDTIGHPQFCPDDDDLILYAGPLTDRVWVTDRSGRSNRRLYARETACNGSRTRSGSPARRARVRRLAARHAAVDVDSGGRALDHDVPGLARGRPTRRGGASSATPRSPMAGCTSYARGEGRARPNGCACRARATSGAHWGGPFPYNDGPVAVEAPQHTHPHPRFSPDG